MVVFYLDDTFNCNRDRLYNERNLRDKSQICTRTSQIETTLYERKEISVPVSALPQPYSFKNTMYRMPKLLWIPSTTNCTRAADIQTIQLQLPSLRISVLGWTIGKASLKFAVLLFLCSTFPDIFQKFSLFHCVSSVTQSMLMKLCSHVNHDPNKRYLFPSRAYVEEISADENS